MGKIDFPISNWALVFHYNRPNKYSFNALIGAIETDETLSDLEVVFVTKEDELISQLEYAINKFRKVVLGISFHTTQIWNENIKIKRIKQTYGNQVICIAGGAHPTGDPLGTLKMGFDVVVRGEGEETLVELLKKIGKSENYRDVKGIAYIDDNNQYRFTGRRPYIDLNKYAPFGIRYKKFGPIEITRGCPYACYFCQTSYLFGGKSRHRSVENVCKYVQIMKERNLKDIRFITPNSFSYGSVDGKKINIAEITKLLKGIREILEDKGRIFFGSFPSEVRPEHVTEETINLVLKYADNDNLIIGGQSGSQRMLDWSHRGHTVKDIYKSVELTIKSGLIANVDFLFGLPNETDKDIEDTLNVISDLIEMGAKIHTHTFMPLPQTPFENYYTKRLDWHLKRVIKKLTSQGFAYGDWEEQEELSKEISEYFKRNKLEN